jgi:hypothetical protein
MSVAELAARAAELGAMPDHRLKRFRIGQV